MEDKEMLKKMLKELEENSRLQKTTSRQLNELLSISKDILDTQEACQLLNIKPRTLNKLRKSEKILSTKKGRKYYYLRENLRNYITDQMEVGKEAKS